MLRPKNGDVGGVLDEISHLFLTVSLGIFAVCLTVAIALENWWLTVMVGAGYLTWKTGRLHWKCRGTAAMGRLLRADAVFAVVGLGLHLASRAGLSVLPIAFWGGLLYVIVAFLLASTASDNPAPRAGNPSLRRFL